MQPPDQLVEHIYDASVIRDGWPRVVAGIASFCCASSALVLVNDGETGQLSFADEFGVSPDYRTAYLADLRRDDLRLDDLVRHPVGTVRTDTMIRHYGAYTRSRAYRELYSKLGTEHALGAFLYSDGQRAVGLRVFRSHRDGPFGKMEIRRYRSLLPHLRRAFRLRGLRETEREGAAGVQKAVDLLSWGVFLVDPKGHVTALNRCAARLSTQAGCDIERTLAKLGGQALAVWKADGQTRFVAAVPGRTGAGTQDDVLHLNLQIAAPETSSLEDGTPFAVAFVAEPGGRGRVCTDGLRALHALTPSEAAVTEQLIDGWRLSVAAERLGISHETARSHLRSVFNKTGISRQADLVREALRRPALEGDAASSPAVALGHTPRRG